MTGPLLVVGEALVGVRLHHGGTVTEISGIPTEEVDPTGAGEVFSGTFLAIYARSGDPILAAREANAAAHVKALGPMESGSLPEGPHAVSQDTSQANRSPQDGST